MPQTRQIGRGTPVADSARSFKVRRRCQVSRAGVDGCAMIGNVRPHGGPGAQGRGR